MPWDEIVKLAIQTGIVFDYRISPERRACSTGGRTEPAWLTGHVLARSRLLLRRAILITCGIVLGSFAMDEPNQAVAELLLAAVENNREAYFVPGAAFDEIMTRLALHCLESDQLAAAKKILANQSRVKTLRQSAFLIPQADPTTIIKSNAWPINCPSEMFEFQIRKWPEEKVWKWLAEKCEGHQVVAVPFKKVLAFGTLDGIRNAFGNLISGEIRRVPITGRDLRYEEGAVISLLRQALIRAVAEKRDLGTDGNRLLWEKVRYTTEREGTRMLEVHRAARISLRRIDEQMYVTIEPTVHFSSEQEDAVEIVRTVRLRILGYQHKDKFNADLNRWREAILRKGEPSDFDYPTGTAAFHFVIKSAPAFAAIFQQRRRKIEIKHHHRRLLRHRGIEVLEPGLRFGSDRKSVTTDTLPLRGLARLGPFDRNLSSELGDGPIRVAVICPQAETSFLERFLADGLRSHSSLRGPKEEYLIQYTGFENVYRVPIIFPSPGDPLWYTLPEVGSHLDEREGALEMSRKFVTVSRR